MTSKGERTVGYIWNSLFAWPNFMGDAFGPSDPANGVQPAPEFVADPDVKRRSHELIEVSGLLKQLTALEAVSATEDQILSCHEKQYVEGIKAVSNCDDRVYVAGGFRFGRGAYMIASLAAGSSCAMVDAVMSGSIDTGYALVNYPGHHAEPARAMGSCIFNNVAIATKHAISKWGCQRVAILDYDVHHGNGTQKIFWNDPNVLFISIHQDNCWPPNSGNKDELGGPDAQGATINIPLPPSCGNPGYLRVMDNIVLPALKAFKPDLIMVSSGVDANNMDQLARMCVSSEGFAAIAERLMTVADELCGGRVVFVQEGGYSRIYVPYCIQAIVQALKGVSSFKDPYAPVLSAQYGVNDLQEAHKAHIDELSKYISSNSTLFQK